jgi:hypothetical protein
MMLVRLHGHFPAAKRNPLGFQTDALLHPALARQQDSSSRSHHAVPGDASSVLERPHHLPRVARKSGRFGHCSIRRHLSARNPPGHGSQFFQHFFKSIVLQPEHGERVQG